MLLYKVIWDGYPPDPATWEPPANISDKLIAEYEASLEEDAAADAKEEGEEEAEAAQLEAEDRTTVIICCHARCWTALYTICNVSLNQSTLTAQAYRANNQQHIEASRLSRPSSSLPYSLPIGYKLLRESSTALCIV